MRPAVPAAQAQTPSPVASWIGNASSMPSVTEKPRRWFGGARQIGEPVLPLPNCELCVLDTSCLVVAVWPQERQMHAHRRAVLEGKSA
jgi:hypothetical protein